MFDVSRQGPDWFKVREKPLTKSVSVRDLCSSKGRTTVINRHTGGWVTVKPTENNKREKVA